MIKIYLEEEENKQVMLDHAEEFWHALFKIKEEIRSSLKYIDLSSAEERRLESLRELIPDSVDEVR